MIKKYEEFLLEKNNNLNEGLLTNLFKKFWDFLKSKFGKDTWLVYSKLMLKKGKLDPKKVQIFINGNIPLSADVDTKILTDFENMESVEEPALEPVEEVQIKESLLTFDKFIINEARVHLETDKKEILDISMNDLKEELEDGYKLRLKGKSKTLDPIFIWGAPGIGKTQAVEQLCKDKGLALIVWHLATVEPVDFVGVPSVENKRTIFNLPAIFPIEGEVNTGGILFFDELNRAKESVLSAALQLCNEGQVGDYKLPANWWIVAAGNRDTDENSPIEMLGTALSARFTHYNLVPTAKEWLEWAEKTGELHEDILAFFSIQKNKDEYYHKMDPEVGDVPWPNPRNWVKASKKYESVIEDRGQPSIDKINRMFSGIVGTEAAIMFCEFLKIKNVFNQSDVEMVYTDPENAKLLEGDTMVLKNEKGENTNVDVTFAVMVYIAYYKNKEKVTTTEIYNLLTYSMRYSNSDNCNVLVVYFKNAHPCLNEDPELKKYWVNATKEWSVKYRSAYR